MNLESMGDNLRRITRHYALLDEMKREATAPPTPLTARRLLHGILRQLQVQTLSHYAAAPPVWRLLARQFAGRRTLPDFCVVGPIKSGTSDVAVHLMAHPCIIPPFAKEFWEHNPDRWRIFYPTERERRRHADRYGTAMSLYCVPALHSLYSAYFFSQLRPDARIVILLRDPIQRSFSQWKWEVLIANRTRVPTHPALSSFRSYVSYALSLFPDTLMPSVCRFPFLQTSIYWHSVKHWIDYFGRDHVLVMDVGDYFHERNGFLKKIHRFVGLPPMDSPSSSSRVNANPIRVDGPDKEALGQLQEFFQPHNDKLWNIIGEQFQWR